jgi:plasmid stability protein
MGTLTIRNLDDHVKRALRKRAAARGVSMEQEAREALARDVAHQPVLPTQQSILEDLRAIGIEPEKPVDLKQLSDGMWEEGLVWQPSSSIHRR